MSNKGEQNVANIEKKRTFAAEERVGGCYHAHVCTYICLL